MRWQVAVARDYGYPQKRKFIFENYLIRQCHISARYNPVRGGMFIVELISLKFKVPFFCYHATDANVCFGRLSYKIRFSCAFPDCKSGILGVLL